MCEETDHRTFVKHVQHIGVPTLTAVRSVRSQVGTADAAKAVSSTSSAFASEGGSNVKFMYPLGHEPKTDPFSCGRCCSRNFLYMDGLNISMILIELLTS